MHRTFPSVAFVAAATLAGCALGSGSPAGGTIGRMQVTSSAFTDGGSIPAKYSCDGEGVSPPLAWSGAAADTKAFALTVLDPDARDFVHWLAADLAPSRSVRGAGSLAEGATGSDAAGTEGRNSGGRPGWYGPCPPSGEHRYVFTVYALSEPLGLSAGFSREQFEQAIQGKTLASGTLTARYRRG